MKVRNYTRGALAAFAIAVSAGLITAGPAGAATGDVIECSQKESYDEFKTCMGEAKKKQQESADKQRQAAEEEEKFKKEQAELYKPLCEQDIKSGDIDSSACQVLQESDFRIYMELVKKAPSGTPS
ncbi:hypothetical protein [Nocardia iowensis]|uniref:Uncharacterized protein n=1 Tax=Nocardia iowensis TaxID=204891 RepID=A0ABX8RN22_NOCIO|nr:hypothetical protein [Nocardia iowensis]QXN90289.1 hypothetical protein KV110_33495 [Nocardia iowensis]